MDEIKNTQIMGEDKLSLKAARVNAELRQVDVAQKLGIGRDTLGKWENGKSYPDAIMFGRLCKLYNVSMDKIFLPI